MPDLTPTLNRQRPARLLLCALLLSGGPVLAAATSQAATSQPAKPVLTMQRVVTVTQNGKTVEQLLNSDQAKPGDIFQVSSALNLTGKERNARFTVPIPTNTTFVPDSAKASAGVKVTFALSAGGPFSAIPMKTVTVQQAGKSVTKEVPAPQNEYRAVRYDLTGLTGNVTVSHRIRVN